MLVSEIQEILESIKLRNGNVEIHGISVNDTKITVCYEDCNSKPQYKKMDYKNCDVH